MRPFPAGIEAVRRHSLVPRAAAGLAVLCVLGGCSPRTGKTPSEPLAEEKITDTKPTEKPFDPGLSLDWPVPPKETRFEAEGQKTYSAMATVKQPTRPAVFMVVVTTYSEEGLRKYTAKQLVESAAFGASGMSETRRKSVELTPQKYPGLEMWQKTTTSSGRVSYSRKLIFMAGTRLSTISVWGRDEAYVNGLEVDAFFKSLKITE
jgi:hypothetical protein